MVAVPKRARVRRSPVKRKRKRGLKRRNNNSEGESSEIERLSDDNNNEHEVYNDESGSAFETHGKHLRLQAVFHTLEDLALFAGVPCTVRQFFDGGLGVSKYYSLLL